MNIYDEISPKYITLYDSLAIGPCVKLGPDLMQNKIDTQKHFHKNTTTSS